MLHRPATGSVGWELVAEHRDADIVGRRHQRRPQSEAYGDECDQ